MSKQRYEQRVVAFIDILGFKNLVNKSESDNSKAINIETILDILNSFKEEKSDFAEKKVALFSDNLIISYPFCADYLTFLLMDLSRLSWKLMRKGVLIRGGIVIGNLY